jgi:hypothetical protein
MHESQYLRHLVQCAGWQASVLMFQAEFPLVLEAPSLKNQHHDWQSTQEISQIKRGRNAKKEFNQHPGINHVQLVVNNY